jgi:hypothetical protein
MARQKRKGARFNLQLLEVLLVVYYVLGCSLRLSTGVILDDDYSLLACDPIGPWRDYIQSDPVHRPPRSRSVRRRHAVTPPPPAWPIPTA